MHKHSIPLSCVIAMFALALVSGCDNDSSSQTSQECDPTLKPATAISCECVNGAWEMCTYPPSDKCATSNCGTGTVCDSNTGACVPSVPACKCDDGTDCPSGDKANCPAETCKCDDGSDCPSGDKANCPQNACKCDDGTDCPNGDKANCVADACICDDGTDCPSGDKANCPADTCKCDDGTDCPDGDKANCIAASACTDAQPDEACICTESTGKWDCSAKCTEAKPEDDCTCSEDAGSWGWKCASNCSTEQPVGDCICQSDGTWLCECNLNDLEPRQTCDCNKVIGQWIESTCTFSCDPVPENAKTGTCQCNNKTGELEGCQYNCTSEKPYNAKACDCDETTGRWKTETCKYNCPDKPARAISCDCDESTGNNINCIYTCDDEPDNVVAGSCTCDTTTGDLINCQYIECNNADKPTEHVKSCECVEGKWECIYDCPGAKPDGAVVSTCVCQSTGEWSCEIDKCQDKTLLVGQDCDKATGVITYNKMPKLSVTIDNTSISENGGTANITVKLEDAQPGSDVPLTLTVSDSSRVTITKPTTGDIIPASKWKTGVTYIVTAKNNDIVDGNINIKFTFKTSSTTKQFNGLTSTVETTIIDDEKPSIILSCDGNELFPPPDDPSVGLSESRAFVANGIDDPTHLKCKAWLGIKPDRDVTVSVSAKLIKSESCGCENNCGTLVTCNKVFPHSDPHSLTFTKDNDFAPIEFRVSLSQQDLKAVSTAPEIYNLYAYSLTAGYNPESSILPIKAHVMPRYKILGFEKEVFIEHLPKGRYRLHAIGASGGRPPSSGINWYNFMETSCTSTGKASFKYKNHGGAGAYIYGELNLTSSEDIYVYTGEPGEVCRWYNNSSHPFNGGGLGRAGGKDRLGVNGGGATDFCIGHTDCADYDKHWPYRILVAGGGGGGSDWSEDDGWTSHVDTEYKHGTGGSAKWISFEKGNGFQTGGNGLHYGAEKGSGATDLYAPSGYTKIDAEHFGKGEDAEAHCSADNSRRNGGGGGGWFGGSFQKCAKDTGGGAGSSYAFNGSNKGDFGKQDPKYKLTNVGGIDGGTSCYVFGYTDTCRGIAPCLGFNYDATRMLGLGNGIAWIEVLDD